MPHPIRVLHTSDWHLGRSLHERQRDDEFEDFLNWLTEKINEEQIDVLLVAGDIFDTSNPSHVAQRQYYDFCRKLSGTCCRHAVITSGNHDSTSFIDVPAQVLECIHIHTVGQPRFNLREGDPKDEIIVLQNEAGVDELIVAAVPFLSEGDVRTSEMGQDTCTREQKVIDGIAEHYRRVAEAAEEIRAGRDIPVVAMGHLFVQGGKVVEDDGVRVTYVGTLGGVNASIFSPVFDYVALGHLHVPQIVGNAEHIRYSGAPIAMGFGEAGQQKSACKIVFDGKQKDISQIEIPTFHKLESISGDRETIRNRLTELVNSGEEVYVAVTYESKERIDSVTSIIEDILEGQDKIRCVSTKISSKYFENSEDITYIRDEMISDLNEHDMFLRVLDVNNVPEESRAELLRTYQELVDLVHRGN